MTDILFIVPPAENIYENPPIGTLLLATMLKNNGIAPQVLSMQKLSEKDDFYAYVDNTVKAILEKKAKIVSFYTRCDVYHVMLKIAQQIKLQTDTIIVFGGPQADIVARETMETFSYVDYICQGEGETTIVPFVSALLEGKPDLSIAGLVYRQAGQIMQNPRPTLLSDLDALPEIDYTLLGVNDQTANIRVLPIDVGRGCPFGCSYCSTSTFWGRKYRLKSPEHICAELASLHKVYGVNRFAFMHDMFTFRRKQVTTVCQSLKELDFPVTWSCSARVDCVDNELIDIMMDAGLRSIYFGVETGSERMQKQIHKNLKLDTVLPKVKYIHSKGLRTTVSFMFGFPEETLEDLSHTLSMIGQIARLDGVQIQTHLCTFLPGTELSEKYAGQMVPASFFSDICGSAGVEECRDMIQDNPQVFPQFLEYESPLRKKLEHFPLFVKMWLKLEPIYRLISQRYERDRLIQMYFDFVECNGAVLEEFKKLPKEKAWCYLLERDALPEKMLPQDKLEMVKECYRMVIAQHSPTLKEKGELIEIFNFSPKEFKRGSRLEDYQIKPTVVKFIVREDGKIEQMIGSL